MFTTNNPFIVKLYCCKILSANLFKYHLYSGGFNDGSLHTIMNVSVSRVYYLTAFLSVHLNFFAKSICPTYALILVSSFSYLTATRLS